MSALRRSVLLCRKRRRVGIFSHYSASAYTFPYQFYHSSQSNLHWNNRVLPIISIRDIHASSNTNEKGASPHPSITQLLTTFPQGVKKLFDDIKIYQNINDASKTKLNAWTAKRNNMLSSLDHRHTNNIPLVHDNNDDQTQRRSSSSIIPRRQQEQQNRLLRDLRKVFVPVVLCAIPLIGNAFILVVAIAPRWFLSNHFFSKEYVRILASMDYQDRSKHFLQCAMDLMSNYQSVDENSISMITRSESSRTESDDLFGNVLNVYYHSIQINQEEDMKEHQESTIGTNDEQISSEKATHSFNLRHWSNVTELQSLPRKQLITLASTSHLYSPITWLLPSFYIQQQLAKIANDIYKDDQILLDEGYHLERCRVMTYGELLDACQIRGLPCDIHVTMKQMRIYLTAYLQMMENIQSAINDDDKASFSDVIRLQLFILYFPSTLSSYRHKNMV